MTFATAFIPTWHQLRGIGKSPLSRLTVLIPVFGFLILFSEESVRWFILSFQFLGVEGDDIIEYSKYNLYFLYFGLLIFSASTLLYNAFCPLVIWNFANEFDFYENEFQIITENRAHSLYADLEKRFENSVFPESVRNLFSPSNAKVTREERFLNQENENNREFWLKPNSAPVYDLLHIKYELENNSRFFLRLSISFLYTISVIMFSVPTLRTVYSIVSQLF